jgi:hypothetical protein
MRTAEKEEQRIDNREKNIFRLKKAAVFVVTFCFVVGLVTVDEAYSEIMGKPGIMSIQTRKIDSEHVTFSLLGEEATINVSDVETAINEIQGKGVSLLEEFTLTIRELVGLAEWPRKELPFQSKIL